MSMAEPHPILQRFSPFSGFVKSGMSVDFTGIAVDPRFFDPAAEVDQTPKFVETGVPGFTGEGYFDLIAVAQAVDAARDVFCMAELGAGYGYWIGVGGGLARQRELQPYLIGVEADPGHFAMMRQHLQTNNFEPSQLNLINAAIAADDGTVLFAAGASHEWWGQAVVRGKDIPLQFQDAAVRETRSISLNTVLADIDRLDVLHMDVQGVELEVLQSAVNAVSRKVRTLIVATHSKEIESGLRQLFAGWESVCDFTLQDVNLTEYGEITFGVGLQIWLNPAFAGRW